MFKKRLKGSSCAAAALVFIFAGLVNQFFVSSGSVGADKLRVLFIGNSYTYFNNLPAQFAGLSLAAKEEKPVEAEMVAAGGATLKKLWDDGLAVKAIQKGGWDYVILQEQSSLGSIKFVDNVLQVGSPEMFHEYARKFDAEIKKVGARTVFYMTWARQDNPAMQKTLTEAYIEIASELRAGLAPVGLAWQAAFKADPKLSLHVQDKSHPNPTGSYLAACVIYSTIYGKSPEGLSGRIAGAAIDRTGKVMSEAGKAELINLSDAQAKALQQIAWQSVKSSSR